jgi:hypothetical protein
MYSIKLGKSHNIAGIFGGKRANLLNLENLPKCSLLMYNINFVTIY